MNTAGSREQSRPGNTLSFMIQDVNRLSELGGKALRCVFLPHHIDLRPDRTTEDTQLPGWPGCNIIADFHEPSWCSDFSPFALLLRERSLWQTPCEFPPFFSTLTGPLPFPTFKWRASCALSPFFQGLCFSVPLSPCSQPSFHGQRRGTLQDPRLTLPAHFPVFFPLRLSIFDDRMLMCSYFSEEARPPFFSLPRRRYLYASHLTAGSS